MITQLDAYWRSAGKEEKRVLIFIVNASEHNNRLRTSLSVTVKVPREEGKKAGCLFNDTRIYERTNKNVGCEAILLRRIWKRSNARKITLCYFYFVTSVQKSSTNSSLKINLEDIKKVRKKFGLSKSSVTVNICNGKI